MYKSPSRLLLPGMESLPSRSDQNHSSQALLQEVWGKAQVPRVLMLLTDGRTTLGAPWPRTQRVLSVRVRCCYHRCIIEFLWPVLTLGTRKAPWTKMQLRFMAPAFSSSQPRGVRVAGSLVLS